MQEEDFPRGGRRGDQEEERGQNHKKSKQGEEKLPFFVQKKQQKKKRALEEESGGVAVVDPAQGQEEYLFGSQPKKSSKQHKKKPRTSNDNDNDNDDTADSSGKHSLLPLGGGGVVYKKNLSATATSSTGDKKKHSSSSSTSEPFIEALGFSRLAKGTKLLGVVREVQEEFALVSLPNLLTGYVLRSESGKTAPPLTHTVSVGQVLACVIVKTIMETTTTAASQKKNGTRRRIQVSLEPSLVNVRHEEPTAKFPIRGKVQAVEDNGVLVDLGHGRKGFLPFADMDENSYMVKENNDDNSDSDDDDDDDDGMVVLKVGQLLDFIVKQSSKADIIPLRLPSPDVMAKHFIPPTSRPSIQAISPGWLVKAKVEALARNGLCVALLGNVFRGAIEMSHLGGFWVPTARQEDSDWKTLFRGKSDAVLSFTARILAVDPATKTIRLTVLPHLMDLRPPPSDYLPKTGTVVQDATVIRLDPGVGALLALPHTNDDATSTTKDMEVEDDDDEDVEDESVHDRAVANSSLLHDPLSEKQSYLDATKVRAVYVHISKAMDEREDGKTSEAAFAKAFAPSTKHNVRILSTSNLIESVASGAAADSIINAHVLTHADLTPSKIFRNVPVCAHLNGGAVLVEFGMEVRGLITSHHLFDQAGSTLDYRNKMLKSKFAIGAKVDVRVLSSDPTTKRCFVTAKKSLLQSSKIITSWDDCKVGSLATGFISKVDDGGLFVTFFNRVFGRVPARSLALELGINDHRENYRVGDVVQCRVVNVKKVRRGSKGRRTSYSDDGGDDSDGDDSRYIRELTLSLRVHAADEAEDDQMEEAEEASRRVHLRAGAVLPEKSMKVTSLVPGRQRDNGTFVPGHAIVSVKSKYLVDEAESATMLPYVECKLPYDQLLDHYEMQDVESSASMDNLAEKLLQPGKALKQKGILLSDPRKSSFEFSTGTGRLTVVSLRPKLVEKAEALFTPEGRVEPDSVMLPAPDSNLFDGAQVMGFVTHIDQRYGGFVRFLDGLTGLVPKGKGGLELELFSTIITRIVSVDNLSHPPKILLSASNESWKTNRSKSPSQKGERPRFRRGTLVSEAKIDSFDFYNANLTILDKEWDGLDVRARIHCTVAASDVFNLKKKKLRGKYTKATAITKYHPFSGWSEGQKLSNLYVIALHVEDDVHYVELTNREKMGDEPEEVEEEEDGKTMRAKLPKIVSQEKKTRPGWIVSVIVKQIAKNNGGICVTVGPKVSGFIPGLECSDDPEVLNDLCNHFAIGARLECLVIDEEKWNKRKAQATDSSRNRKADSTISVGLYLSIMCDLSSEKPYEIAKPVRGDLVVGRVQRSLKPVNAPSLMLELRGGYVARCCVSELEEMDEWSNMPLGNAGDGKAGKEAAIVSGESDADGDDDGERFSKNVNRRRRASSATPFPDGKYVPCRVLQGTPSRPLVDVSLRSSRIEGDLEEDDIPGEGETRHAYVVATNKKGCFVRLSRNIEGRVIIKELADEFLPNPAAAFPPGRLVSGKVKAVKEVKLKNQGKTMVDLDMRESAMLESEELQFADVELQSKHKGTVTRVEEYGVFVRLSNSKISGLVHKSECSDKYVKNIFKMYDPGDLVKVLVIRKDEEAKKISFSMKASHFVDDEDSEDESLEGDASENSVAMEIEEMPDDVPDSEEGAKLEVDSDDPDFASKLASSLSDRNKEETESTGDDSSSNESEGGNGANEEEHVSSDSEDEESNGSDDEAPKKRSGGDMMDTDVGFDWSTNASALVKKKAADPDSESGSDEDNSDEDDENRTSSTSHKSRKKQAQKRREEQEISRRETALADGTADDNPETAADFERLLSGSPNSSEIWIRYMAFHLALVDIPSARAVAKRAFARIEFTEEREKLNVWCALLALELKYGSPTSFQATLDQACQQNNPKQVYLRACEMVEKEANHSSPETVVRADEMFEKMCKKFKSKKQVWIAHLQYLLKGGRHKEAHDLLRRSLQSLAEYKHVETMSKFAQLEFEFGSPERARTIFDGILLKHPKRLDLLFVFADKEVKHGSMQMARSLFEKIVNPRGDSTQKSKLSDKQMKSLFKKWYRLEEEHGTLETQEHVKDTAKAFVGRATA